VSWLEAVDYPAKKKALIFDQRAAARGSFNSAKEISEGIERLR